jgi:hypothetical protein
MNQFDQDLLLDRGDTAAMLTANGFKTSRQTLAWLACTSEAGPVYQLYHGRALYQVGPTLEWAKSRLSKPRRSSTEATAAA